jgi:peptidoglycan/LPS O-acetylase OafA/YrhL
MPPALAASLHQKHLPSLDGLRALSVLLVVAYHAGIPAVGGIGTKFLFGLSGFLITWLLLKEESHFGEINLRHFYARRFIRIVPAFYVFVAVIAGLALLRSKPVDLRMTLTSIAYVSNYYQGFTGNWDTPLFHSWSLCIEQQFYLLWPLGLLKFRSTRNRIRFLAFTISGIWAGRFLMVAVGAETDYIYCALETRADNILVGCLAALMLHAGLAPVFWRRVTESASVTWLCFLLLALSLALVAWKGVDIRNTVAFMVDPLLCMLLLVKAIATAPAWLNGKACRYISRISYSVYLYHMLATPLAGRVTAGAPDVIRIIASVLFSIAAGSLAYHLIEQPLIVLKDRFSRKSPKRPLMRTAAA